MKRLILVSLVVVALLTAGVVPQAVYADDGKKKSWLKEDEERYVREVQSRHSLWREDSERLRELVRKPQLFNNNWNKQFDEASTRFSDESSRLYSYTAIFADVPESMKDIDDMYNEDVRSRVFGVHHAIVARPDDPNDFVDNLIWLSKINEALDEYEGTLAVTEVVVGDRVRAIEETREEADEYLREGCFIATAAYGTPAADEIDILRQWRDEFLMGNPVGEAFVAIYYEVSPPIAEFISEHEVVRTAVREAFVDPVVGMVELTQSCWAK